jgi:glycosyltransferase involved in cell wall biosynthesis
MGARWPTVISERVHPAHHAVERPWRNSATHRLSVGAGDRGADARHRQLVQPFPQPHDACHCQSVDLQRFGAARIDPGKTRDRCKLIAVGRLVPQKGYDLLIAAFAHVAASSPDWDLVIYGEGSERTALQGLIDALGLSRRILLAGNATAMEQVYAEADLLVHPARYEGYPNAIQEALAAGKAVIATDCPGATRELLGDGRYGVLVPSEKRRGARAGTAIAAAG